MSLTHYQRFKDCNWRGWISSDWRDVVSQCDPLNRFLSWSGELVHQRPMSCTWRVEAPGQTVFVKLVSSARHHNIARGRWEAQLKQSFGPSVALRTHQMTQRMLDRGLHVPEVLVAAHRRQGWHCDDLLATKQVEGLPLVDVLNNGNDPQLVHDTLRMVGQRIAQLHQAGFVHGHLVPGHIVLSPDHSDTCFLDNDETRWRPAGVRQSDRLYNLTQLISRIDASDYQDASGAVRCLIDAYFDTISVTPEHRRQWHYRILKSVRHRNKKRPPRCVYRPLPALNEPVVVG